MLASEDTPHAFALKKTTLLTNVTGNAPMGQMMRRC